MAALAGRLPGHRLLLIDLPGHGLSPPYLWQGAPVREQAVNVIAGVLDGLGIDQVTLVGNSLGGLFSLWFALDRPYAGRSGRARRPTRGCDRRLARRSHDGHAHRAGARPGRDVDGAAALAPVHRPHGPAAHGRRRHGAVSCRTTSSTCTCSRCACRARPRRIDRCCGASSWVARPAPSTSSPTPSCASFTVPLLFVWPEDDQFLAPAAGKPSVDKIPTARFVTTPAASSPGTTTPTAAPPSSPRGCSRHFSPFRSARRVRTSSHQGQSQG